MHTHMHTFCTLPTRCASLTMGVIAAFLSLALGLCAAQSVRTINSTLIWEIGGAQLTREYGETNMWGDFPFPGVSLFRKFPFS
jgi:hypothetical protein